MATAVASAFGEEASTIQSDAEFFDSMLDLIPVSYYYPPVEANVGEGARGKFMHNKKAETGELSLGKKNLKRKGAETEEESETAQQPVSKKSRSESRQDMFDPANYRTVLEIQRAALGSPTAAKPAAVAAAAKVAPGGNTKLQPAAAAKLPAPSTPAIQSRSKEWSNVSTSTSNNTQGSSPGLTAASAAPVPPGSVDELRQRLHAKMRELSNKRKQDPTKQEKQELKQKSKPAKPSKPVEAQTDESSVNAPANKPQATAKGKSKPTAPAASASDGGSEHVSQPVDEELHFTFQALKKTEEKKSSYTNGRKRENDQAALRKAEAQRESLAKLEATDPEKAAVIKQKIAVKKAALRLEGVTVKDDIKLLKKNIKKAEAGKKKSRKAWKEREDDVKAHIKQKQSSREENLKNRALNTKRAQKRKARPGFEGAAKFLN